MEDENKDVPPPAPDTADLKAPLTPPRPQSMADTARGRLYLQRFTPVGDMPF